MSGGTVSVREHPNTDEAVSSTAGVYLAYQGQPAVAQYSASNGGWSRAGGRPYLVAKSDPYDRADGTNPWNPWRRTLSRADVQRSCPLGGSLVSLEVSARDGHGAHGGRITHARVECTTGTATLTDRTSLAFGLPSNQWSIIGRAAYGAFDAATPQYGSIHLWGWAIEPDVAGATTVEVILDGGDLGPFVADGLRVDVGAAFPGAGDRHGSSIVVRRG